MPGVIAYFIVGGVAAIATFVATPLARKAANRFEIISAPDERDVHESPTPNLGGPAMLFGLLAGSLAAWLIGDFSAVFSSQSEILGVLLSAVVMCVVGVIDDVKPITAPAKIAGMVIAGSVLSLVGVSLVVLRIPFVDVVLLTPDLAALATVLWVVLLANAINLIDGLDGLATGIVAIASTTFVIYAIRLADEGVLFEENPGSLIAVLIAGMCWISSSQCTSRKNIYGRWRGSHVRGAFSSFHGFCRGKDRRCIQWSVIFLFCALTYSDSHFGSSDS